MNSNYSVLRYNKIHIAMISNTVKYIANGPKLLPLITPAYPGPSLIDSERRGVEAAKNAIDLVNNTPIKREKPTK